MSEKIINNYVLKLSGKVELPHSLDIGHNYKTEISGSITSKEIKDNNDGTMEEIFRFEPILVELIDSLGQRLKTKDTRSASKLFRALCWSKWKEYGVEMGDEEFYQFAQSWIRRNADEIFERIIKEI